MLNEKYSYQSFKRKTFVDVDPAEFSNSEIIGACFYQDDPYNNVFPKSGVKNCLFTKTNVDNCIIPVGFTVGELCTNKHFAVQNDGEYWLVDAVGRPTMPRDVDRFVKCGLSILPASIPPTPLTESITWTCDPDRIKAAKIDALAHDRARLEQILIDAGELPAAKAIPIGD